jgi:Phage capsid protein
MSYTVQQHHVLQFTRNVEHLLQQMGGKLPGYVSRGSYTGKSAAVVDQVGTIGVTRNRARHADTPHVSVPGDRRWVNPTTITTSTLIDQIDDARMLIDLRSPYAKAITEALGRADDDEIGAAFFGTSAIGEQGQGTVAFPAAQIVGVNVGGTNSGMNVPKLRAAKRLLMASGLDLAREKAYIAITATEHDNLLGELQVTSLDYNVKPTLVEGRVSEFMGFSFIHVEWQGTNTDGSAAYPIALPTIAPGGLASTTRNIPVWVESGMHYGQWNGLELRIDPRPDKNYNTQLWAEQMVGATRTQEKKVVQIVCLST